ncbi:hypothetical protein [Methanopyrus kandleri]
MEGIGGAASTEEGVILTERGEEFFGRPHESAEETEAIPQEATWVEEPGEWEEWRPRRFPRVPLPKAYLIVAAVAIGLLVAALLYYAR